MNEFQKQRLKLAKMFAKLLGGRLLSDEYVNSITRMKWVCSKRHIFRAPYNTVQQGHWCPRCHYQNMVSPLKKNEKFELAKIMANKHGGKLLSKEYIHSGLVKMKWVCSRGHVFRKSYNSVQRGTWCPKCWNENKWSNPNEMLDISKELATKYGGFLLSKKYPYCRDKLKWQCSAGHVFWARYDSVKRGSWCPYCVLKVHKTSINVLKYAEQYISNILGKSVVISKEKTFSGLLGVGGRKLKFDGYYEVGDIKICLEYNGYQHYQPTWYDHFSKEMLQQRQENDRRKIEFCKNNDVSLLVVSCFDNDWKTNIEHFLSSQFQYVLGVGVRHA